MDTRWWVLTTCCFIVFFPTFFDQLPGVVSQRLTGIAVECNDGTDTCVNFSLYEYNLLVSVDLFVRAVVAVFAGVIIDKRGTKHILWGCAVCMIACWLLFALGVYAASTTAAYAMMFTARLIYGVVYGAYSTTVHRIKAGWFMYKELALAFSIEILFDRLGSATVFLMYGGIVGSIGLRGCVWLSFGFSFVAAAAMLVLSRMDSARAYGTAWTSPGDAMPRTVWHSFRQFDTVFWLVMLMIVLTEGSIQSLLADGALLFATAYGISEANSTYITGIIYDLSLLSPLYGWLTDKYGKRQYSIFVGVSLVFLGILLALTVGASLPAVFLTLIVGVGYSIYSPLVWSSIPLVTSPESTGLGLGIGKFMSCGGSGAIIAAAGAVLAVNRSGTVPWGSFLLFLTVVSGTSVLISPLMIFLDTRTGNRLSASQRDKQLKELSIEKDTENTPLNVNF